MSIICTKPSPIKYATMMFGTLPNGAKIYVPKENVNAYKSSWTEYAYAITAISE